ncbi:MAG: YfhO family protein [Deltaproteobacteria bacterium]|nr:YfhO family protein [Deltaproteobacteria bacterium]
MSGGERGLPRVAAFALIAVGAVAFWWFRFIRPAADVAFAAGLGNVDFFAQIYPMSFRAAAWIADGVFPLWNPYQLAGHPFHAAALYGLCYPPNVLYLLLPTAAAIEAVVVLHLILSGWFTYRYAEIIGLAPIARLAAAAVYMFCGFMTSQANWFTPAVASSTWLPLALIAVERLLARRDARSAALLATALALALLGGWTQFWLYTVYAVGLYAGVRLVALAWHGTPPTVLAGVIALLVAAVGVGTALTAVQLLPTRELQALGPRRLGGVTMAQLVPFMSLPPARLAFEAIDWRATRPFISVFYFGPIVLALVGMSLCALRSRVAAAAMWIMLVASALVAVALNTPFFEHVYLRLPFARLFRLPQRIAFLVAFSAAALAGFGVDVLRSGSAARRALAAAVGIIVLAGGAAGLALRAPLAGVELGLIGIASCLFVATVRARGARLRANVAAVVTVLVVANFAYATRNVFRHPFHGVAILHEQDRILDYVRARQGLGRTYLHDAIGFDYSVMNKQGTLNEIYSITDYEPLNLLRFEEVYDAIGMPRGIAPFTGWLKVDPASPHLGVLDVLSLKYWVVANANADMRRMLGAPGSPWRPVPAVATQRYQLFEHASPLPRAYVATHVVGVADAAASLGALLAPGFDPRRSVIVEDVPDLAAPRGSSAAPSPVVPARITRYEPRMVRVEVDAPAAGVLVLTDTWYPGWRATVDEAPAAIHPANHLVRAVPVGAGHHVVAFRYEPASVQRGALVSGLALLVLATLVVGVRPRAPSCPAEKATPRP